MIAPRNKLLFWAGMILLPAGVILAIYPEYSAPLGLAALGFVGVALLDAWLAVRRAPELAPSTPEIVRFTQGRDGQIPIHFRHASNKVDSFRFALDLPPSFTSPEPVYATELQADTLPASVQLPCTPTQRGKYKLDKLYLERTTRLGFWNIRTNLPIALELRVYPDLFGDGNQNAQFLLHRGTFGIHTYRRVGKGREFEQLREYIPGDSYEDIHWKATARRGHPVTKVFQLERTQEVYAVIDASRLSARGSGGDEKDETHLEHFIQASLTLSLVAQKQGDHFGLLVFADQVLSFVRAGSGPQHFQACREALYNLQPQEATPDFEELATFIRLRLRRRALLIFLTDLDDPVLSESFLKSIGLLTHHHLLLVSMIMGREVQPLFAGASRDSIEAVYEGLASHFKWQELNELQRALQHKGVSMGWVASAQLTPALVSNYLRVKQRQIL